MHMYTIVHRNVFSYHICIVLRNNFVSFSIINCRHDSKLRSNRGWGFHKYWRWEIRTYPWDQDRIQKLNKKIKFNYWKSIEVASNQIKYEKYKKMMLSPQHLPLRLRKLKKKLNFYVSSYFEKLQFKSNFCFICLK